MFLSQNQTFCVVCDNRLPIFKNHLDLDWLNLNRINHIEKFVNQLQGIFCHFLYLLLWYWCFGNTVFSTIIRLFIRLWIIYYCYIFIFKRRCTLSSFSHFSRSCLRPCCRTGLQSSNDSNLFSWPWSSRIPKYCSRGDVWPGWAGTLWNRRMVSGVRKMPCKNTTTNQKPQYLPDKD